MLISRQLVNLGAMWVVLLGGLSSAACATEPETTPGETTAKTEEATKRPEERFEFTSYTEVRELFEELNYTPEAWQAGIREVPRVYLTTIPPRWRDRVSKEVAVLDKKRIFFRARFRWVRWQGGNRRGVAEASWCCERRLEGRGPRSGAGDRHQLREVVSGAEQRPLL